MVSEETFYPRRRLSHYETIVLVFLNINNISSSASLTSNTNREERGLTITYLENLSIHVRCLSVKKNINMYNFAWHIGNRCLAKCKVMRSSLILFSIHILQFCIIDFNIFSISGNKYSPEICLKFSSRQRCARCALQKVGPIPLVVFVLKLNKNGCVAFLLALQQSFLVVLGAIE